MHSIKCFKICLSYVFSSEFFYNTYRWILKSKLACEVCYVFGGNSTRWFNLTGVNIYPFIKSQLRFQQLFFIRETVLGRRGLWACWIIPSIIITYNWFMKRSCLFSICLPCSCLLTSIRIFALKFFFLTWSIDFVGTILKKCTLKFPLIYSCITLESLDHLRHCEISKKFSWAFHGVMAPKIICPKSTSKMKRLEMDICKIHKNWQNPYFSRFW